MNAIIGFNKFLCETDVVLFVCCPHLAPRSYNPHHPPPIVNAESQRHDAYLDENFVTVKSLMLTQSYSELLAQRSPLQSITNELRGPMASKGDRKVG